MSEENKEKKAEIEPKRREMGIEPWRPWSMIEPFDKMWEDFARISPRWTRPSFFPMTRRNAFTDLIDRGKEFEVRVEVPGIPREKLSINVTEDSIEVSGRAEEEKKEEEQGYIMRERGYSEVFRHLAFPEKVIPDKAEATLKGGVLQVKVPKKTPTEGPKGYKPEIREG